MLLEKNYRFRGYDIAWTSFGHGDPIVLIHGFPWSAQSWRKLVPWLSRSHEVFVYDMLGTGQSEKHDSQIVDESAQAELLVELIEFWGTGTPHVIAHDFGGLAALRAHFMHGAEFRLLHLIDAVALLPSGSPFFVHVASHEAALSGLPDYAHEALFRAYIQNAAYQPLRPEISDIYLAPYSGKIGNPAFYRQIAQADTGNIEELEQLYRNPEFPVHLIWGEHDSFIPPEQGRKLAMKLQADNFILIPDAAHLVQEDAPEALLVAILTTMPP